MEKKPLVNDKNVRKLFFQYNRQQSQRNETLINLYNIMEPLLKWTITGDITKIYSSKIKKQKYSKLYNLQKSFSNGRNTSPKINFTIAFERYLKEYIDQYGYWDSNSWNYSLIYPFWEVVEKVSLEDLEKSVVQYNNEYSYYLAIRFCDDYWNHIYKCVRKDLAFRMLSIDEIQQKCNDSESPYSFDEFQFSNRIYNSMNDIDTTETLISDIKNVLTCEEWYLVNLYIEGYTHAEVSAKSDITPENSRQMKSRIIKKLRNNLH